MPCRHLSVAGVPDGCVPSLQANERDALREAGRKKLDEYRKLKAALLNGDFIEVQTKQRTFSNSNLAAAEGTNAPPPEQQEQQQETSVSDSHDPMVDVLLSQVGAREYKADHSAQCCLLHNRHWHRPQQFCTAEVRRTPVGAPAAAKREHRTILVCSRLEGAGCVGCLQFMLLLTCQWSNEHIAGTMPVSASCMLLLMR